VAANPAYISVCRADGFSSLQCVAATIQATNGARAQEGLGGIGLPSTYSTLTAAEQLFVLADIERVSRRLPPAVGLVDEFDRDAQAAAQSNTDPTPSLVPPGVQVVRWASNWDENTGPLGSNYSWMYDDGAGSGNLACPSAGAAGCWGHRDNILGFSAAEMQAGQTLVMGAGEAAPGGPWLSDTELLAVITGNPAYYIYTWGQAVAAGAY
jgi:hypothetical protein